MQNNKIESLIYDYVNEIFGIVYRRGHFIRVAGKGNVPVHTTNYFREQEDMIFYWFDRGTLAFAKDRFYWKTKKEYGSIEYDMINNISYDTGGWSQSSLTINSKKIIIRLNEEDSRIVVNLLEKIKTKIKTDRKIEEGRKRKLQLSKTYETALRYEDAAKLYEELDMWGEAGRVRTLELQAKSSPTQVSGENVHIGDHKTIYSTRIDDHSVRDSVIQRSTIDGTSQKKISICPYCGEKLNFPETPRFCPYCGKQILM